MRSRLAAIAVVTTFVAVGCARENPEFGLGADGGATGSTDDGGTTFGGSGQRTGGIISTDGVDDTDDGILTSTSTTMNVSGPDSTSSDDSDDSVDSVDSGGVSDVSGGEACDVENCEPYQGGCAAGLKCTLHDEGLDGEFDKLACSAVVDGPDSALDQCTYDECGQDSCDYGLACAPAGPSLAPGMGVCRALCHEVEDPCRAPDTVCIEVFGTVGLCRDRCQLLLQDCANEEGCFLQAESGDVACAPANELNEAGASCDGYSDCAVGYQCVSSAVAGGCPDGGPNCCVLGCDSTIGAACDGGDTCLDLGTVGQGPAGVCVG